MPLPCFARDAKVLGEVIKSMRIVSMQYPFNWKLSFAQVGSGELAAHGTDRIARTGSVLTFIHSLPATSHFSGPPG